MASSTNLHPLEDRLNANESRLLALRESIRAIERMPPALSTFGADALPGSLRHLEASSAWTLGEKSIDDIIGATGLDTAGVHEFKSAADMPMAAAHASALRFALALVVRRLLSAGSSRQNKHVLLCATQARYAEAGAPYGPGLIALGIDPSRLLLVETARETETLWAIEEGLKSKSLALVFGQVSDIPLTPARRLALAADGASTPCFLLTHPRSSPAAATATRWRVAPAPSAGHGLDPSAPGAPRFRVELERCRSAQTSLPSVPYLLEWCDAAYRFRVVSSLGNGSSHPRQAKERSAVTMGPNR